MLRPGGGVALFLNYADPSQPLAKALRENIGMHDEKTAILDDYPAVIYTN